MSWAEHGYGANLRLADFATDRTALATHHQGETLTAEHGFPLHLVVPHLYGHKGPKSLRGIKYLTEDGRRLLGRTWLPQHRRPLSRTALLLPGATSRRVTPVTVAAPRATRTARCLRRVPPRHPDVRCVRGPLASPPAVSKISNRRTGPGPMLTTY